MKKPVLCVLILFTLFNFRAFSQGTCATVTAAVAITGDCTAPISGDLYNANTTTAITGSCAGVVYDSWYQFTMPVTSTFANVKVTSTVLNDATTFVEVFNATACGTTMNNTSLGCFPINKTNTVGPLTANAIFYVRVYSTVNPNSGSNNWKFTLCVTSNDNCATATTITSAKASTYGSVWKASTSAGVPAMGCATGTADDDVWFKFTAADTVTNISLGAIGAGLSTSGSRIQVYSGATCGAMTAITGACGNTALTLNNTVVGNNYFVRVYSAGSGTQSAPNTNWSFNISVWPLAPNAVPAGRMSEVFQQTIVADVAALNDPWEVTYGHDDSLWVTEAKGYKIQKIHPGNGGSRIILDLTETSSMTAYRRTFSNTQNPWPQGGMMGMALHPNFATTPYVYVAYVKNYIGLDPTLSTGEQVKGHFFRTSIVKFTYNGSQLVNPETICDTIRGSNDHNSGRMIIAPVGGVNYLFYACGDQGGGQFDNIAKVNKAQDLSSVEGKILRFNLESDNDNLAAPTGNYYNWIPNDNPFNLPVGAAVPTTQTAIWASGMRNNQGFATIKINGVDKLYGSSHGPFSDDELNYIEKGKNYGHPIVIGYNDGNYNGARAGQQRWPWSGGVNSTMPVITTEQASVNLINGAIADSYRDPVYSFYDTAAGSTGIVNSIQYIYTNTSNAYTTNGTWASEAPSGMDIYKISKIPNWKNSLLLTSLKKGRVLRLKFNATGTAMVPIGTTDTVSYFGSTNRFRDLAYSPDGNNMFIVIDKSATTSGPSASSPLVSACGGCLQKYTFLGYAPDATANKKSTMPTDIEIATGKNNACDPVNTVTINATNWNNNLWVPITDTNSNIVAEINAQGKTLGNVTASIYKHKGTTRSAVGKYYLDKSVTITPQVQPTDTVMVRIYITQAELDSLKNTSGAGVTGISSLKVLRNSDACGAAISSSTSLITPMVAQAWGSGYVIQFKTRGFSTFYFGSQLISLPVHLLNFKGTLQNEDGFLQWETAQEINSSYFEVERSLDGNSYTAVGRVNANGSATSNTNYSLLDPAITQLPTSVVYYRLKMVDRDGGFEYSNIVTINLPYTAGKVVITPNPVVNVAKVKIASVTAGKANWTLVDNTGRVVLQGSANIVAGNNQFNINMSKLTAGIYFLNLSGAGIEEKVKMQKL